MQQLIFMWQNPENQQTLFLKVIFYIVKHVHFDIGFPKEFSYHLVFFSLPRPELQIVVAAWHGVPSRLSGKQ